MGFGWVEGIQNNTGYVSQNPGGGGGRPVWEGALDTPTSGNCVSGTVRISGRAKQLNAQRPPIRAIEIDVTNGPTTRVVSLGFNSHDVTYSYDWDTRPWMRDDGGMNEVILTVRASTGDYWNEWSANQVVVQPVDWAGKLNTPASGNCVSGTVPISGWAKQLHDHGPPIRAIEITLFGGDPSNPNQGQLLASLPFDSHDVTFNYDWDSRPWAGQNVTVEARPSTGDYWWRELTADSVTIGSEPSKPTSVTINPSAPGPEPLTARASGSTDPDGDDVTYEYQWSKKRPDGTWEAFGHTGEILPAANVRLGDTWRVRARAYDGSEYSFWYSSWVGGCVKIGPMATYLPKPGTRNVARSSSLYIDFRWIPVQSTVTDRVVLKQGTTVIAVTKSWVNNKRLRLKPKYYLKPGKWYRVYVSPGIECTSGRALNWAESHAYFVTAPLVAPTNVSVAAAPTAAGAQVTLNLSAAATVRTVICNLAGRTVAELAERDLPAGVSSLVWNGKNAGGAQVPAGTYLVRVEAREAQGQQATGLTQVRLGR